MSISIRATTVAAAFGIFACAAPLTAESSPAQCQMMTIADGSKVRMCKAARGNWVQQAASASTTTAASGFPRRTEVSWQGTYDTIVTQPPLGRSARWLGGLIGAMAGQSKRTTGQHTGRETLTDLEERDRLAAAAQAKRQASIGTSGQASSEAAIDSSLPSSVIRRVGENGVNLYGGRVVINAPSSYRISHIVRVAVGGSDAAIGTGVSVGWKDDGRGRICDVSLGPIKQSFPSKFETLRSYGKSYIEATGVTKLGYVENRTLELPYVDGDPKYGFQKSMSWIVEYRYNEGVNPFQVYREFDHFYSNGNSYLLQVTCFMMSDRRWKGYEVSREFQITRYADQVVTVQQPRRR